MDKKKENNNNKQKSDTSEPKEDELLIESNNENNNNNKQKSDTPEPKGDELFIENDNENNDKQGISGLNQGSAKMPNKNLNVPKQRLSKKNNKRPTLNVVSETTKEIMNFYRSRRRTRVSKDRYSQPSADQEDKSLATAVSIVSLLVFNYVITKFLSSFLSLSNDGSYLRSTSEA